MLWPALIVGLGCLGCLVVAGLGVLAWNFIPGAQQAFVPTLPAAVVEPSAIAIPTLPAPTEPTSPPTQVPATETPIPEPTVLPGIAFDYQNVHLRYDASLASQINPITVAASGPDAAPWEVAPEHYIFELTGYPIQGAFHDPRIIIYPLEPYIALDPDIQQVVDRLRNVLQQQPAQVGKEGLPFLPYFNAAQLFTTQIRYLDGKGVRYLTQYAQSFSRINNHDVFYTYQGLAGGDKFYVIAILPVNHTSLPANYNIPNEDFEAFIDNYPQYLLDVHAKLDAEPASSFNPGLELLDNLVKSIEVK